MKQRLVIVFCLVCLILRLPAQQFNPGSNWYFGQNAGITFTTSPPTALQGSLVTQEGVSTISDASGHLLFYTDGSTVYTATHSVMSNGSGLGGNNSTAQSAVIVKQPGNTNLYYVFAMGVSNTGSLSFSVVDMSLAGGAGSVTVLNSVLYGPCLEKLTAVRHANNTDYWIVVHESSSSSNTNFRAYLLTSTGVSTNVVVSSVGSNASTQSIGYLKFSPDGMKLASGFYGSTGCELYDFNRSNGTISNPITLNQGTSSYGVEFSPDGTLLYASGSGRIAQWQICSNTQSIIAATMYTMAATNNWALQLGPDGRIYVARYQQTDLGIIGSPNSASAACNYTDQAFSIFPAVSRLGLPNYVTSFFMPPPPQFTTVIGTQTNGIGCMGAQFFAPSSASLTLPGCSALAYSLAGMQWNFGDPNSGSNNTSSQSTIIHQFSALGTFTVKLILSYSGGMGNDTLSQVVNITQPCISVNSTSITCATLGSATVQAIGGIGPFTYTWMPTNQTSSVATGLSPGTYTIKVFDFGNNYSYTATTTFIPLIPLTASLVHADSVYCNGAATATAGVINIAGGSGSQTYLWASGPTTVAAASPTNLSAGLWSLTVTDALTGCQYKDLFIILQPPALTLNLSASNSTACTSNTINLTSTISGGVPGYSYSWTAGPTTASVNVSRNVSGPATYTLKARDAKLCQVSQTLGVNFVARPSMTVVGSQICPLQTGTVTASGANNYTWSTNSNASFINDTPNSTTVYTVTGEALGCTSTSTAAIQLKPIPTPLFSSNSPVCENKPISISGGGGAAYLWSGPSGFTATGVTTGVSSAALSNAGIYQVTVTAANGCTAQTSGTVVVNPTPTIALSAGTVCVNGTLNLNAQSVPGSSFHWTGPLGFNSVQQNPSIPNPVVAATGQYTVLVTAGTTCSNSATVNASVTAQTTLALSANAALCELQTLTVSLSSNPAGSQLSWMGPNSFGGTSPTFTISNISPSDAGTYVVGAIRGPCTATAAVTITVYPLPHPAIVYNGPVCEGKSMTVAVHVASNETLATAGWNLPGGAAAGSLVIIAATQASLAGVYTATVTDPHGCAAAASETIDVLINPLVSASNNTICFHDFATLSANGAVGYQWQGPDLSVATGGTATVGPASFVSPASYTVVGTAANGCTAMATATMYSRPLPVPVINTTPANAAVCLGSPLRLEGSGGWMYIWEGPGGNYWNGQTYTFTPFSSSEAGTFTLTVTDVNGCSARTTAVVTVNTLPTVEVIGNFEGCEPYCSTFTAKTADPNIQMVWDAGGKQYQGNKFSPCFRTPGKFKVSGHYQNSGTGCLSDDVFSVTVYPRPLAAFNWLPEKPVEQFDEAVFTDISSGSIADSTRWFFQQQKLAVRGPYASLHFDEQGRYPVVMMVTSEHGCKDTAITAVDVLPDFTVFIPNSFTPDGDGLNDVFTATGRGIIRFEMVVFDRWGESLYKTESMERGWDGKHHGVICMPGAYAYLVKATSVKGETKELQGSVILLR